MPRSGPAQAPVPAPAPFGEGAEKTARVRSMFDAIAPRYDLVNRLMTFGLDQSWRRRTVDVLALPTGSLLLDLACGTGDLTTMATRRGHRVVGADLSWGMLGANHGGAPLVQADSSRLPFRTGTFDGVVCGYALRNFGDVDAALSETARVLRPGGRLAVLEVDAPASALLRSGYDVWFNKVVPLIGGALSDRDAYHYLPRSVAYLPPGPVLRRLLGQAGFSGVGIRPLAGGLSQLLFATRAGTP
jgi:demethylmenaquinone methyltransferase / 2-methoxy-6-polyprenyl-1,4-benzoquinol methylase